MTAGVIAHFRILPNGCWEWHGPLLRGYGRANLGGKTMPAHRAIFQALVGEIPEGLQLDHTCTNAACVNPDHLEAVTQQENIRRQYAAQGAERCKNGHPLIDSNITKAGQHRRCKTCWRQYKRAYERRRKAVVA